MDNNNIDILANEFTKESVVITYTDFLKAAKVFSLDSMEWGDLSFRYFYTTGQNEPWSETSDNGHGGSDLSWAFHKSDEQIEKLADIEYADILLTDVENFLDNHYEDISTKENAREIAFRVANNLHELEISSKYGNHAEAAPNRSLYFGETSAEIENQPKDIQAAWSNKDEPLQADNLIVEGHTGTWYVIDTKNINGIDYSLLESEDYGDDAACLIVDAEGKLILDDVYNGFLDLEEHLSIMPEDEAEQLREIGHNAGLPARARYFDSEEIFDPYAFDGSMTVEDYELMHKHISEANARSRLFVDMDGTLAVFTPVDTLETLYEPGYFANLEPQQKVIDAIKLVIAENPNVEVNILSAYLTDSEFALKEKNEWIDRHIPEIDAAHRVFTPCGEDKKNFINNLKKTDFLLDDYTKNLTLWEPPATGIKLLNGINHTHGTWQGNMLRHDNNAEIIASNINAVLRGEQVREQARAADTEVPLPKGYTKISEYNNIIMASEQCADGSTQYAIWHIEDAHNGVWGGTYVRDNITAAEKCFAIKSGMVDENTIFDEDELTEIYKCLQDTTCGQYNLTSADSEKIAKIGCKIEQAVPNIHERIYVEVKQEAAPQAQPVPTEDLEFEL